MAIALVLTVGASLLLNSFVRLLSVDPGFSTKVLAAIIILPNQQYPTPESKVEFFRRLLERVEALPGVESAGDASRSDLGVAARMSRSQFPNLLNHRIDVIVPGRSALICSSARLPIWRM